jgi:hypothetical protein
VNLVDESHEEALRIRPEGAVHALELAEHSRGLDRLCC